MSLTLKADQQSPDRTGNAILVCRTEPHGSDGSATQDPTCRVRVGRLGFAACDSSSSFLARSFSRTLFPPPRNPYSFLASRKARG